MGTLTSLNTYAAGNVAFTYGSLQFTRSVGNTFVSPTMSWDFVRDIGNLTGNGVSVTYTVGTPANTTVAFNSIGSSENPLSVTTGGGSYTISGILSVIDYNAAQATFTPYTAYTGNVTYTAVFRNTNVAGSDNTVPLIGVPG